MLMTLHFEFNCPGSKGIHLDSDSYPIKITKVDGGSPADEQGVPVNSVMVVLNEQQLKQNDGQNVREHVMHKLNEQRVSFDVVTFEELSGFHAAVFAALRSNSAPASPDTMLARGTKSFQFRLQLQNYSLQFCQVQLKAMDTNEATTEHSCLIARV